MNTRDSLQARFVAAAAAACAAAAVAGAALTAFVWRDPGISFEMTGRHPSIVRGLHPAERVEDRTFAWSTDAVRLQLPGADRRVAWSCEASVINWRPPAAGPATVRVTDSVRELAATTVATADAVLAFTVPASPGSAFDVTIHVTPTFRPGPQDPRALGLAFDSLRCAPVAGTRVWPDLRSLGRSAAGAGLLGVAIGAAGVGLVPAVALASAGAVLQAAAQTFGAGPYLSGEPPILMLTALAVLVFFVPVWLLDLTGLRSLSVFARAAIGVSAVAAITKLAFLLHPAKPLVDALFHAHRFQSVLGGEYYFTQLSTSATPFPYAIGLYVFAVPWSAFTDDHVLLLRLIVYGAEAGVGLLLYAMLARVWDTREAGLAAVVLFHVVPLPFAVIGNANLTNAFGQSAALAVLAAATLWTFTPRGAWAWAGMVPLAALAFISHVSIFVLLSATLATLTVVAWVLSDRETRRQVHRALATALAGALVAVVLYWGHFGDVYRAQLARGRTDAVASAPAEKPPKPARTPFTYTAADLGRQVVRDIGWPVLLLAAVGAWEAARMRRHDRLALLVAAWAAVAAVGLTAGAVVPISPRMQQDVWEFMGRVELAAYPAAVVLAGVGVARGWQAGLVWRGVTSLLMGAAFVLGAQALARWF